MSKEDVRKMTGMFAAMFSHTGHISREEAKEISGLDAETFEEVHSKASNIIERFEQHEEKRVDKLMDHFGEEVEEYMKDFDWRFFA